MFPENLFPKLCFTFFGTIILPFFLQPPKKDILISLQGGLWRPEGKQNLSNQQQDIHNTTSMNQSESGIH